MFTLPRLNKLSLTCTKANNNHFSSHMRCKPLLISKYFSTAENKKEEDNEIEKIWKRGDWKKEGDEDKMTQPKEIVKQLEKYIIGQEEAKKSFSLCFRNRWRRKQLKSEISDDIISSNLLLIGPTGVGKSGSLSPLLLFIINILITMAILNNHNNNNNNKYYYYYYAIIIKL